MTERRWSDRCPQRGRQRSQRPPGESTASSMGREVACSRMYSDCRPGGDQPEQRRARRVAETDRAPPQADDRSGDQRPLAQPHERSRAWPIVVSPRWLSPPPTLTAPPSFEHRSIASLHGRHGDAWLKRRLRPIQEPVCLDRQSRVALGCSAPERRRDGPNWTRATQQGLLSGDAGWPSDDRSSILSLVESGHRSRRC